jgi:hypothetical protein
MNKAFQATNTIYNQLCDKVPQNKINSSGIYKIKCNTCNNSSVDQTGRSIGIWRREHTRYIKTNNPISAYALHVLNNRHEYGNADQTIELLKTCNKGIKTNCWESLFIHIFQQDILIDEQRVNDLNPLRIHLGKCHKTIHHEVWCLLPVVQFSSHPTRIQNTPT